MPAVASSARRSAGVDIDARSSASCAAPDRAASRACASPARSRKGSRAASAFRCSRCRRWRCIVGGADAEPRPLSRGRRCAARRVRTSRCIEVERRQRRCVEIAPARLVPADRRRRDRRGVRRATIGPSRELADDRGAAASARGRASRDDGSTRAVRWTSRAGSRRTVDWPRRR